MKIIEGDVDLRGLYLEELPEFLKGVRVTGHFVCSHNRLTTLKNAPAAVESYFDCSHNRLVSLEGAPEMVAGPFYCYGNAVSFTKKEVWDVCEVQGEIIA